jgi:carbonic anhydrase
MKSEFVTCLNCIDGRVQLPVINWILKNYDVKYVDMITTPGVNGVLADKNSNVEDIFEKLTFSNEGHSTELIFIVGHHDCLANPMDDETHHKQIIESVERIKESYSACDVIGLWVDCEFNVQITYEM